MHAYKGLGQEMNHHLIHSNENLNIWTSVMKYKITISEVLQPCVRFPLLDLMSQALYLSFIIIRVIIIIITATSFILTQLCALFLCLWIKSRDFWWHFHVVILQHDYQVFPCDSDLAFSYERQQHCRSLANEDEKWEI